MISLPAAPLRGLRSHAPAAIAVGVAGVLLLGTKQALTVPYTGLGLPPSQLILFLLGVLWVLTRLLGQRAPAGLGLLSGLIVVRLMLTLISYGLASGRALLPDDRTGADQTIRAELISAFLVISLAVVLRRRQDIEFVLKCLVVGSAVSAVVAILQFTVHTDISSVLHLPGLVDKATTTQTLPLVREGLSRPGGVAAQPLEFGGVMTVTAPVAGALFFAARRRGERGAVWALAAIIIVTGGVVSLSRSVFIGLGVAVVVMMLRWPARRTGVTVAALVATVGIALLAGGKLVTAISTLLTKGSNDYSLASRADGRSYVLDNFAAPLLVRAGPRHLRPRPPARARQPVLRPADGIGHARVDLLRRRPALRTRLRHPGGGTRGPR